MVKKKKTKEIAVSPNGIIESFTNNLESIMVFVNNVEPNGRFLPKCRESDCYRRNDRR